MLEPDTELLLLLRVSKFRTLVGMLEHSMILACSSRFSLFRTLVGMLEPENRHDYWIANRCVSNPCRYAGTFTVYRRSFTVTEVSNPCRYAGTEGHGMEDRETL